MSLSIVILSNPMGTKQWHPFFYKGAKAAEIFIDCKFTPPIDPKPAT